MNADRNLTEPDSVRVYTRAELRSITARPRVNRQTTYRVAAPRRGEGPDATYAMPTPCCGLVTRMPQYNLDKRDVVPLWFECGKPWNYQRGNSRRGGCRAIYKVAPVDGQPEQFDLTWTGQ